MPTVASPRPSVVAKRVDARDAARPGGSGRRATRSDGERSRARILEAAGKLFAGKGFDAASIRELARAAEVNLSAIAYHFGDKEGLYRAVIRQVIDDSEPLVRNATELLTRGVAEARGDRRVLARVAAAFIRGLYGAVLVEERLRWQMALMLREFYEPSPSFQMDLEERIHPMHNAVASLVAAATGKPADAPETRLVTASLIGQCMAFGAARTVICARLGWDRYTPERVDQIIAAMVPAALAVLGLPALDEG